MGHINQRELKHYLINKDYQIRIILYSLLFIVLTTIFTIGITFFPSAYQMVQSTVFEEQLAAAETYMLLFKLLPGLLSLSVLFLCVMICFTHRFCGPMVNFMKSFKAGVQGDLTLKVHLRKKDYLKKESFTYNEMIENVSRKLTGIKKNSEEAQTLLNELLEEIDKSGGSGGNTITEKANRALKSTQMVCKDISFFKLPEESDRMEEKQERVLGRGKTVPPAQIRVKD